MQNNRYLKNCYKMLKALDEAGRQNWVSKVRILLFTYGFGYILGQKRNAAYKTYIVYGGNFTNLSQTICHSLIADSWFMSSWGFPNYHCHRTKLIDQFKPTFLSILTSRNKAMTSWVRTVWHCSNLSETFPKTFNHPCMASKLLGYHRWRHVSL